MTPSHSSSHGPDSESNDPIDIKTVVPPDEQPAATCPYCGRPFATDRFCLLHLGDAHRDEWTDTEREAFEDAYDDESDELFVYHLKVIIALVVVFFAFAYVYVFVWT